MSGPQRRVTTRVKVRVKVLAEKRPDDSVRRAAARPCLGVPGSAARRSTATTAAARGRAADQECRAGGCGFDRVLGVGGFRRRGVETVSGAHGWADAGGAQAAATTAAAAQQCARQKWSEK